MRGQASPQQPFFAIGAHIFQKQITKHPIMDIPAFQTVHTGRHTRIIIFITTRIGQVHLYQGQAQRLCLCCRDFPLRAVNSDPIEHFVKGRDKADQFNIGALAGGLQGKGAILARGPGHNRRFFIHDNISLIASSPSLSAAGPGCRIMADFISAI